MSTHDAAKRQERSVIGAFYAVYNELGFGFLEEVYAAALEIELRLRGHRVAREVWVDVYYRGQVTTTCTPRSSSAAWCCTSGRRRGFTGCGARTSRTHHFHRVNIIYIGTSTSMRAPMKIMVTPWK
jgi:hypothetical protein